MNANEPTNFLEGVSPRFSWGTGYLGGTHKEIPRIVIGLKEPLPPLANVKEIYNVSTHTDPNKNLYNLVWETGDDISIIAACEKCDQRLIEMPTSTNKHVARADLSTDLLKDVEQVRQWRIFLESLPSESLSTEELITISASKNLVVPVTLDYIRTDVLNYPMGWYLEGVFWRLPQQIILCLAYECFDKEVAADLGCSASWQQYFDHKNGFAYRRRQSCANTQLEMLVS